MLTNIADVATGGLSAEESAGGQNGGGNKALWEAEWSQGYTLPPTGDEGGGAGDGAQQRAPTALVALRADTYPA